MKHETLPAFGSERTRRAFLRAGLALPALWASARTLAPTPAWADADDPTPSTGAGPFFTPRSPERTSFRDPGLAGTPIELGGRVLGTDGRPLSRALLDFWHTDDTGEYDNDGYRCRGHQYADADGRYVLRTIVPGAYGGRPKHIHVKLAGGGRALTTQLLFPEDARNGRDGLFDERLAMKLADGASGRVARFDFVLG
jgi:protocatechuate 3,4-dioxygenase beta subunit